MSRSKSALLRAILLLVAFLASILVVASIDHSDTGAVVGEEAPPVEFTTYDGQTVRLADLRGQGVLINFWASWCGPCRAEADLLQDAWQRARLQDVVFVGVNYLDQEDAARRFLAEYGIDYLNAPDRDGEMAHAFGVDGLPATFVIDREGVVRGRVLGAIADERTLADLLEAIVP